MKTCYHPLATRPILYTDTIGGHQTRRDDLWAVTTDELNALLADAQSQDMWGSSEEEIALMAETAPTQEPTYTPEQMAANFLAGMNTARMEDAEAAKQSGLARNLPPHKECKSPGECGIEGICFDNCKPGPTAAPAVPDGWMSQFEELLDDYIGACVETAIFNVTQRSGMTVRMAGPRRKALMAHVRSIAAIAKAEVK